MLNSKYLNAGNRRVCKSEMFDELLIQNKEVYLFVVKTTAYQQEYDSTSELFFFLLHYSFLLQDNETTQKICTLKTTQFHIPQGNGENGARYLDPKYSRWISVDPALGEYVPAAGKGNSSDAGNLPGMGGIYNSVNGNLYHYAGNNPVKYIDPDGRISGYLNDSTGAGGFGHSAMFVQLYNKDGTTKGIAVYEVASVFYDEDSKIEYGYGVNGPITGSKVLSHETVGGFASSSKSLMDSDQVGVFVRIYEGSDVEKILDNMRNSEENQRYDNVLIMDTDMKQDMSILAEAEVLGKNFGTYKVILNNCTEFAAKVLRKGDWETKIKVIPNNETDYIRKNNTLRPVENWTKTETASQNMDGVAQ